MEIAKTVAGFSGAEADDLRKAVGKKNRTLMATMEGKFLEGCSASKTDTRVAQSLWSLMTAAADYSFNKSHAACYALISYRTAYLKANYPAEYMAALISSVMSTKDKVPFFVNRCAEMGIEVLPPDVSSSDHGFVVSGNRIRFGLDAVKNVGHAAVEAILAARERAGRSSRSGTSASGWTRGRSTSERSRDWSSAGHWTPPGRLAEECSRCSRRRRARGSRPRRIPAAARARYSTSRAVRRTVSPGAGQTHPRSRGGVRQARAPGAGEGNARDLPLRPPARGGARRAAGACRLSISAVAGKPDGTWVTVGGIVGEAKKVRTRSGGYVMFATLDDVEAQVALFVRDAAGEAAEAIVADRVVVVRGRVDHKGRDETSLVVAEAETFEPSSDEVAEARRRAEERNRPQRLVLRLDAARLDPRLIGELKAVFELLPGRQRGHPGDGHQAGKAHAALRARLPGGAVAGAARRARPAPGLQGHCGVDSRVALKQRGPGKTHHGECRECRTFCDKLIEPRGCLELRCRFLYSYFDPLSGNRYMGCMKRSSRPRSTSTCSRRPN